MKFFQVFEHETVIVGDTRNGVTFEQKHFEGLSDRLGKKDDSEFPFYSLVKYRKRDGIKFRQYVGAIRTGDLTIEILPKTDRDTGNQDWKSVLLFMLSKVLRLNVSSESFSPQHIRSSTVLDFIVIRYLNETETLLHQGLINTYINQEENLQAMKGRMLFSKQISKNNVHKEKFYVSHTVYDKSHIMNRILRQALSIIAKSTINPTLKQRAAAYIDSFPCFEKVSINEHLFSRLVFDRKTERYREAMSLAELIVLNNMPDLSIGRKDTFAMLFDMNRLWEEFVYMTLRKHLSEKYSVKAQVKKHFWENKVIIPDIVLRDLDNSNNVFVLDTKWKRPDTMNPADGDLHQMYAYSKFYGAKKAALLYPNPSLDHPVFKGTFADGSEASCDMVFLPMPRWNRNGKEWQQEIADTVNNWLLS